MDNVTLRRFFPGLFGTTLLILCGLILVGPGPLLAMPVADAGDDQEVLSGQTVHLDGTGSTGDIVSYYWNFLLGPYVDLGDGVFTAQPSFVAPEVQEVTELRFYLEVMDSLEEIDSDMVSIWVYPAQNGGEAPTADAGEDQYCNQGDSVTLDGSGSTGTEIVYQWRQTGGPEVALNQAATAQPSFEAPPAGGAMASLSFQLTVTDAGQRTATDSVSVNVFPANAAIQTTPDGDPLGIRVGHGSILSRYVITTPDAITSTITAQGGPEPVDLPHGLADIRIESENPLITGTVVYTATATFFLPAAAPPRYGWAKLSLLKGWMDFSDHVVFNPARTVVTMTLTDGGPGDDNAAAGIIDDPSGLALMTGGGDDDSGGGGGDGGLCFITTCRAR